MPWLETAPMDERLQFLANHQRRLYTMTELCAGAGVGSKSGYKRLARYAAEGPSGLHDRSHAPHRIDCALATLLLTTHREHPT